MTEGYPRYPLDTGVCLNSDPRRCLPCSGSGKAETLLTFESYAWRRSVYSSSLAAADYPACLDRSSEMNALNSFGKFWSPKL